MPFGVPVMGDDVQKRVANWKAEVAGDPIPFPEVIEKPEPKLDFPESQVSAEDVEGGLPEHVQEINSALDRLDIFKVYDRLVGKQRQDPRGRTEGIMASCPNPSHPDVNPSAWFGMKDGKWLLNCGKCEEGWDVFSMAAMYYGIDSRNELWEVKVRMAEDFLGLTVEERAGGMVVTEEVEETKPPFEEEPNPPPIRTQPAEPILNGSYPEIDWKHLIKEDTFQWAYMTQTSQGDEPEPYHFWNSYIAVGLALGRNTRLFDRHPVLGNLWICKLGGTGFGKSRSNSYLEEVLEGALPYQDDGLETHGVKICGTVASGEALLDSFSHKALDPSLPSNHNIHTSITGIADYDEYKLLTQLWLRQGSILQPLMMKFYNGQTERQRTRSKGLVTAKDPFCSLTSGTQPRSVRSLITDNDSASGLVNRWIFAAGPPKEPEIIAMPGFETDLSEPIRLLAGIRSWSVSPGNDMLYFDHGGEDAFKRFIIDQVFPAVDKDSTDTLNRLNLHFKKLCLLTAANEQSKVITEEIVYKVAELFPYLIQCYGIINAEMNITPLQDLIQTLERVIGNYQKNKNSGMTVAMMRRYTKKPVEDLNKAVRQMALAGIIKVEKRSRQDKRQSDHYILVEE